MGQVLVDFLSVSSEALALAITFVFIDHVQNTNITITTNYLSPDPACPIHNLSLIWLDTGWTWLALWLNGFCLGISMMDSLWTWRTDSINGWDPDGMSLMMYNPAHAWGVRPGPSAVFRVSACLWTWTLTFRGVQVGSREWLGGDWIIVTMPSHQTPGSGGSWSQGNCVSVWTMTMLCQMTQGRVTAPDLSFYLNRYLISAMTRGKPESLILSTIYCYFKIF